MSIPSWNLVVVTAGAGDPSWPSRLVDRTAQCVAELALRRGRTMRVRVIDLRRLAIEVTAALLTGLDGPNLRKAAAVLRDADGVLATTPVYRAGASGLFTSFFQVVDTESLAAKPIVLAAAASTSGHALVVEDQLRSLFACLGTATVPTSLSAWPGAPALAQRIERAAFELVLLMEGGCAPLGPWRDYPSGGGDEPDLDAELMRLTGGGPA